MNSKNNSSFNKQQYVEAWFFITFSILNFVFITFPFSYGAPFASTFNEINYFANSKEFPYVLTLIFLLLTILCSFFMLYYGVAYLKNKYQYVKPQAWIWWMVQMFLGGYFFVYISSYW